MQDYTAHCVYEHLDPAGLFEVVEEYLSLGMSSSACLLKTYELFVFWVHVETARDCRKNGACTIVGLTNRDA
jgi:hypothetical protein